MHLVSPDQHPLARAFKAAVAANVTVVAAGGNGGAVGEASLGGPHQMIGEVITVSNSEHGRSFTHTLEASGTNLDPSLTKIDGGQLYAAGDTPWTTLQGGGFAKGLCGEDPNTGARDKIALIDYAKTCSKAVVNVPANVAQYVPAFIQQVVGAKLGGAKAAVVYVEKPNTFNAVQLQQFALILQIFRGQLPEQLYNLPPTMIVINGKTGELATWTATHSAFNLAIHITPERVFDAKRVDMAADSTAQGPAPRGLSMKPDISAPGTNILASVIGGGYAELTGTSMASPAVTGAVAVLRQAWPDWTPAEVKEALMATADPVVTSPGNASSLALATTQGAGRLDLARAMDPGLLVSPPALNLGSGYGRQLTFRLRVKDARAGGAEKGPVTYAIRHEPHPRNVDLAPTMPEEVTVPAGGEATVDVAFDMAALPAEFPDFYDGRILLKSADHEVRVTYAGRVLEEAKDALLINARRGYGVNGNQIVFNDTTDYRQHWEQALQQAELSYDVWDIGTDARNRMPTLSTLQRYNLVIVAGGDANLPLEVYDNGRSSMTGLANYLQGGGRMLASGSYFPDEIRFNNSQNSGSTHMLKRYFGGFQTTADDVEPAGAFKVAGGVFDKPVLLSTGGDPNAAGNGNVVDLGAPLSELDSAPRPQNQPQPPDNSWSHLAAEQIMPHVTSVLEDEDGASAMTAVSGDASLEEPRAGAEDGVVWRALFAGFPIEAVKGDRDHLLRADLLRQAYDWLTEPEPTNVTITAPDGLALGRESRLVASADLPPDYSGVASWRWDAGDGKPFQSTQRGELRVTYPKNGKVTVRVELTSKLGHRWLATAELQVSANGIPATAVPGGTPDPERTAWIYLPMVYRDEVAR